MYCIGCGADNIEGSMHCIRCGQDLSTLRADQYTKSEIAAASAILWNPDFAALLSIPFTPVFGAIIHALNWSRLGQSRRAMVAWLWVVFVLVAYSCVGIYGSIAQLGENTIEAYLRVTQMVILPFWYFATARAQGKYIVHQLKGQYFRESWLIPIAVSIIIVGALYGLTEALQ